MDSRGRAFDNIFVERLWRTVKYEDVYLKGYETMTQAQQGLKEYFQFYNEERFHQALQYRTPREIYQPKGETNVIHISTAIHKEKEKKKQKKKEKFTTTTNLKTLTTFNYKLV